ncbi:glycosyltransferase [Streptomyces cupreus]|uniref:Glycosyltransferase n=1 Tax=Streptomyces cupreus TaxID=2759956 RepID=A0A7X1MAA5_9ACTN|nr:glycosyltransferase [Streptomyces cupreus]MBC2903621.1 glycosyltransferase [Streptomyces cupreus]
MLTALACLQQVMLAAGLGGWLPGYQPWPYLLAAAPLWLLARPWEDLTDEPVGRVPPADRLRRVPAWTYLLGVLLLAAGVWAALQDHEPYIGHEEAVYANKARSWLNGTPDAGWGMYRPVGLPALGALALALHNDVGALRAVALILALFTLTATYLVAARWTTPRRAVVVVLLLLSGLGFLRRIPEFLNDIGATGLLLLVVFLLVRAQEKKGSRALLAVPLVALAAFYLRYGVVGNLAAVCLAALLAYGPRAWAVQGRRLLAAVAIVIAGLFPHFVYATKVAGWPLGLVFSATAQANRAYVGDGLVYYLAIFPYRLAGDLGAVVMGVGVIAAIAAVRRVRRARAHELRADDRRRVFLGTTALLVFVILGFATDGEPRFVYLSVVLLTVLGVDAVAELTGRQAVRVLTAVATLAALTVLGTAQVVAHGAMPGPTRLAASTVPAARQLASPGPCLVVTGYEPEVGWYSGCDAVTYAQYKKMRVPADTEVSLLLFERGRLQPGPAGLKRLIGDREPLIRRIPTQGSLGTATVLTLR